MRNIVHNFQVSLEKSHELIEEADWMSFYKLLWPNALLINRINSDCEMQRKGIDVAVWLASGKQIYIDEKRRDTWYGDILLETISVGERQPNGDVVQRKRGWAIDGTKHCDFIAYAIPSVSKCFMLPFQLLRRTVIHNASTWKNNAKQKGQGIKYPIDAPNEGYWTRSIAVTWDVLSEAMKEQMSRRFGSEIPLPPISRSNDMQLEFDWCKS